MARIAVTSDYYSILGVSPTAEEVVIRAAYRALVRHYHPDSNPDPEAAERVRAINAAFAVLRDPARRAEYDAQRAAPELWRADEMPVPPSRPPAMRGLAIASLTVAVVLVVAVAMQPQPETVGGRKASTPTASAPAPVKAQPIVELAPEAARLARLSRSVAPPPPQVEVPVAPPPAAEAALEPVEPTPPARRSKPVILATAAVSRPAPRVARVAPVVAKPALPAPPERKLASVAPDASAGCRPGGTVAVSVGCKNERLVTLDRMAAGFFSQSMAHADAAKKELLMSSHTRSAAARAACRSDSCVGDAYVRQMREISAIMEGRAPPQ